jgi:hypothetical protein
MLFHRKINEFFSMGGARVKKQKMCIADIDAAIARAVEDGHHKKPSSRSRIAAVAIHKSAKPRCCYDL